MNGLVDQIFGLADDALSGNQTNGVFCLLSFTQPFNESAILTYL